MRLKNYEPGQKISSRNGKTPKVKSRGHKNQGCTPQNLFCLIFFNSLPVKLLKQHKLQW